MVGPTHTAKTLPQVTRTLTHLPACSALPCLALPCPALPACRFSLTPSGRKRFASAMARSSNLEYLAQQYSPGEPYCCAVVHCPALCLLSPALFPALPCPALPSTPPAGAACCRQPRTTCPASPRPFTQPHHCNPRIPAPPGTAGGSTPAIRQQLEALGESDVGYACRRFPQLGLSVIGGRPFSRGGTDWKIVAGVSWWGAWGAGRSMWVATLSPAGHCPSLFDHPLLLLLTNRLLVPPLCTACTADFYEEQYGISGFQDSAHRILDLALQAQPQDLKVS